MAWSNLSSVIGGGVVAAKESEEESGMKNKLSPTKSDRNEGGLESPVSGPLA